MSVQGVVQTVSPIAIAHDLLSDEYATWSVDGAVFIADYLWEFAGEMGEPVEYDRVAVRCEFSEYVSLDELASDYPDDTDVSDGVVAVLDSGAVIVRPDYI